MADEREGRRDRLWDLFDQAADLAPPEQRALLDTACPDDPDLRAELERLLAYLSRKAQELEGSTPQDRARVQEALRTWQTTPDLAGVRDAGALAALPAAERAGWEKLWADVTSTRARARDRK